MRRKWLLASAAGFGIVLVGIAWQATTTDAQNPGIGKKAVESPLPIRQVVLFNSGVGYFQREGEVEGNAQIELAFPTSDINDLLKSLVLQDLGGGKISTVSYDSHDPIDKILRSFALDLNGNPTFGQILNQARGERIELLVKTDKKDSQTSKLSGAIVGMELKRRPIGKDAAHVVDMDSLNISGANGLQSVNLEDVLGVRFLNPTLESEFQRALRVLASSHDTQKKSINLGFTGAGKRAVRVGYVVERPIWKTSYRLRIEPAGKIFLQGWAMVENTSDDDWNNVRMVLVSGRPISFEMNLYEPLYIPRPVVEPEMFASLRPPVYDGAMAFDETGKPRASRQPWNQPQIAGGLANPFGGAGGFGGGGFGGGAGFGVPGGAAPPAPVSQGGPADVGRGNFIGGYGGQGFAGGQVSGGFQGNNGGYANPYQINSRLNHETIAQNRLTYEELQKRRQQNAEAQDEAKAKGAAVGGMNFKEGIASVAVAEEVGDYYQYVIDQKVTLSRQKSAMLPILDQTIDGAKVSIFNEETHAKYPLLGLRLKNTSGQPLTQGPITVYDNGTYAGDTRILDLQPKEERLLSYALDVGTEIKTEVKTTPSPDMYFRLGEPQFTARYKVRRTTTYAIKNRSTHDRTVILEHPIQEQWALVGTKANETTRSHYRFTVKVASGKSATFDAVEEQARDDQVAATNDRESSHAVVAGIHVKAMSHAEENKLVSVKIEKGHLASTWKSRVARAYHVQNLSEQDRSFTVDHVIAKDWAVIDAQGDPKPGPGVHRFKLDVAKGKTGTHQIIEERVAAEEGSLLSTFSESWLRFYMIHAVPSADVKAGVAKVRAHKTKLAESHKQIADLERSLKIVSDDQARLRSNLQIIPQASEPYKKFLDKFVAQESEIEGLQRSIRQTQAALQTAQREYEGFVANLNAE